MKSKVPALVAKSMRNGTERSVMLLGVDLRDAKEEVFVRMVTDGISMGVAFMRAGFKAKSSEAPYRLWSLPRIQERAAAILEARRTTGVVTLPQVTSMLQRVYSNAFHADEFNAAHNAALSLARLYGHVNDRQTLEVIRRPSRDPDAPSEQELSSWVAALPSTIEHEPQTGSGSAGSNLALSHAPAAPLSVPGSDPSNINDLAAHLAPVPSNINDLAVNWFASESIASESIASDTIASAADVPGRPENGAPTVAVTGTPSQRGHSDVLAGAHSKLLDVSRETNEGTPPPEKKRVPRRTKRVPVKKREKVVVPSAKDLFG